MDLEGIMVAGRSQKNTNTACSHLDMESRTTKLKNQVHRCSEQIVGGAGIGMCEIGGGGSKVQTCS